MLRIAITTIVLTAAITASPVFAQDDSIDEGSMIKPLDASTAKSVQPQATDSLSPLTTFRAADFPGSGAANPSAKAEELMKKQEWSEAVIYLNGAIVKSPKTPNLWADRGMAFYYLAQYRRSIDDLTAASLLNKQSGQAFYFRGMSYEKLGNQDLAKKDLQKAKALGYVPPKF